MKKRRGGTAEIAERAGEIKDVAREIADVGGDAIKDFVSTTGSAAKEFASVTASAAKDLLDTTEKAVERLNRSAEPSRRGRKVLKASVVFGVATAILANEKSRGLVSAGVRKLRGAEPQPWEPPTPAELKQTTPSGMTP